MAEQKLPNEIAADIIIAMLEHAALTKYEAASNHKEVAERVAEAYKIIYNAVAKPLD